MTDPSDPQFLVQTADDPGILDYVGEAITGFAAGAYSWPFDYTLCLNWIAGSAGFYGERVRSNCDYHRTRIITILDHSAQLTYYLILKGMLFKLLGDETALRAMRTALSRVSGEQAAQAFIDRLPQLTHSAARFAGRSMTGAAFTAWMQTGGRVGRAVSAGRRIGIASFNFVALLWGSALHVSIRSPGSFDLISVFFCWITGDPNFRLSSEEYVAFYRTVMSVGDEILADTGDQADFENYRQVIGLLLRFGWTGGSVE
ncbi:MAG: hypothetical protein H6712_13045 [Myxococcales bacterium]|nr:hypothetical protein [Myxococcales bacterium]MCB9714786.1 hypothetical protein [Myxococcales bacterium]